MPLGYPQNAKAKTLTVAGNVAAGDFVVPTSDVDVANVDMAGRPNGSIVVATDGLVIKDAEGNVVEIGGTPRAPAP